MWLIRNDEKELLYRVTPGKQHIVSRKDGDLLLVGDQSISRKHAELSLDDENKNVGLEVQDLGSKYGTFAAVDGGPLTQLSANEKVRLSNGDHVRFGIQWNTWRAEFVPLLVATSTLTPEEKAEVKQMIMSLGGQVISDWNEMCTHLTMNRLTVTVKVVCALACCQPIVTPAFWERFTLGLSSRNSNLPDFKDFLPPLAEAMINPSEVSFAPNPVRRSLFKDYVFVACSPRQLKRIEPMIKAAGGRAVEFSARTWTETKLLGTKVILMQHSANDRPGSQQSQVPDGYIATARRLRAQGVRCIPEAEIGLSVLHCSLSQYCNPRFSAPALLGNSQSAQPTQHINVICPNSEGSITSNQAEANTVPGPSVETTSKKRNREELGDEEKQPNKNAGTIRNSEEMVNVPHLNQTNKKRKELKNDTSMNGQPSKSKAPINNPVPSVDMFASNVPYSGSKKDPCSSSSTSKEKVDVSNPPVTLDIFASSKSNNLCTSLKNKEKAQACNLPSLDLFAPSGNEMNKSASVPNQNDAMSSREDEALGKKSTDISDEFSFISDKKKSKPLRNLQNENDDFSFVSNKTRKNVSKRPADIDHSVSYFNTKENLTNNEKKDEDEFSFASNKRPNKKSRQTSSDMFAPTADSSFSSSKAIAGLSKDATIENQDEFKFQSLKRVPSNDDLFSFSTEKNSKRRRQDESIFHDNNNEVKIGLFSKPNNSADPGPSIMQQHSEGVEDPPEPKDLITYSKHNAIPVKVKQELEDEVDNLAQDFANATVIVIKSLVKVREKPADTSRPTTVSGKNFKKFCKVVPLNKRVVPHIIGGSDLVPHHSIVDCKRPTNFDYPPSPQHQNPDDDWAF